MGSAVTGVFVDGLRHERPLFLECAVFKYLVSYENCTVAGCGWYYHTINSRRNTRMDCIISGFMLCGVHNCNQCPPFAPYLSVSPSRAARASPRGAIAATRVSHSIVQPVLSVQPETVVRTGSWGMDACFGVCIATQACLLRRRRPNGNITERQALAVLLEPANDPRDGPSGGGTGRR